MTSRERELQLPFCAKGVRCVPHNPPPQGWSHATMGVPPDRNRANFPAMQRHSLFDFWLHDDAELGSILGSPVAWRMTLRQWPLSCVQRLQLADGRIYIYKAQLPPTVEPQFYENASSPLFVKAQAIPHDHGPKALLLEDVQAPRLADLQVAEPQALAIVENVVGQIGDIQGNLPTIVDIRTEDLWQQALDVFLTDLRGVAEANTARGVTPSVVDRIQQHSDAETVRGVLTTTTGLVHGDLVADNVLVTPTGQRVLDWQRPIWGPVAIDRAILIESLGLDPRPYVPKGAVQLVCLLQIGWYARCARSLFPAAGEWLGSQIVRVSDRLFHAGDGGPN
jgi:hypothetical protein